MTSARKLDPAASTPRDVNYAAGEVLLKEGDASGDLWIIRAGTVEVFRERKGRRITLTRVGAGEMLGTMTATTGAPRSASVRAVTDVQVTIVSKEQVAKLIKGLPPWALGFIKDLVNRVNYVNELYIDHEVTAAQVDESPLQFVWRLAKTAAALSETIAVELAGRTLVPIGALEKALSQLMGSADDVHRTIELFCTQGLLVPVTQVSEARAVPIEEVNGLSLFANLLASVIQGQDPMAPFTMPLAQGERRMLQELARLGQAAAGESGELVVPLAQIEDDFRKKSVEFSVEALMRAQKLNLLTIDKGGVAPSVMFDHQWLTYALGSLGVIREVMGSRPDDAKGGANKKTLLY